jgi:hypothetical protein
VGNVGAPRAGEESWLDANEDRREVEMEDSSVEEGRLGARDSVGVGETGRGGES